MAESTVNAYTLTHSDGNINIVFWCTFCQKLHYHGGGTTKEPLGEGNRVAHCTPRYIRGSNNTVTPPISSFNLKLVGEMTPELRGKCERMDKSDKKVPKNWLEIYTSQPTPTM